MRPKKSKRKSRNKITIPDAPWLKNKQVTQEEAISSLRELFTPEEREKTLTESAEKISEMSDVEVSEALESIPEPTITSSPPVPSIKEKLQKLGAKINSKKPVSINRPGRRPDYSHGLIGLNPGDIIVFIKNPKVEGRIIDHTYGVEIAGQIFNGIVPSAQYAYKISNIQPPKRVTGLTDWMIKATGVKISKEYDKIAPIQSP